MSYRIDPYQPRSRSLAYKALLMPREKPRRRWRELPLAIRILSWRPWRTISALLHRAEAK
jgi:hypothetical protein